MRQKASGVPGAPLEGSVHGLSHKVTCSELQCWDSSLKNAGDIQGGAELTIFTVRTGGARAGQLSAGMERHLCSSVEPSTHPAGRHRWVPNLSSPLTWLIPFTTLWQLRRSTQLIPQGQIPFSSFSTQVACLSLCCRLC